MPTAQEEFNVSMSLTKKELIQKYEELLNTSQKKVELTGEPLTKARKIHDEEAIGSLNLTSAEEDDLD